MKRNDFIQVVNMPKRKAMSKKKAGDLLPDTTQENRWLNDLMAETRGEMADGVAAEYQVGTTASPWKDSKKFSAKKSGGYKKCAHDHPPLKIKTVSGVNTVVYGGVCGDPVHKGLDIYVALDQFTSHDPQAYPWHGTRQFIYFPITDMSTPKDPVEFKAMIDWLGTQMTEGKSVHVGCLGGHGRTGMVLAALVSTLSGNADAITYVREFYCEKAVETKGQVDWLAKHFGIKPVEGYKDKRHYHFTATSVSGLTPAPVNKRDARAEAMAKEFGSHVVEVKPVKLAGNIWGLLV